MADQDADVIISYLDELPPAAVADLHDDIHMPGLRIGRQPRPSMPYAGVEWLLPTAVVLYFAKSYFDGFLKEAGREHYHRVAAALANRWARFFGPTPEIKVALVATAGKVDEDRPYSPTLSLMAEGVAGRSLKLLLCDHGSPDQVRTAVAQFLQLVAQLHAGSLDPELASELDRKYRRAYGMVLLALDPVSGRLVVIDPLRRPDGEAPQS